MTRNSASGDRKIALSIQITGDTTQLTAALHRLEQGLQQTGQRIASLFTGMNQTTQQATQRMVRHFDQMQQQMTQAFSAMQRTVGRVVGLLAGLGLTVSFTQLARGAVTTAAAFEDLDSRLRFLTESAEAFNRAKEFIVDFAATTPLQIDQVADAFVRLTSSGLDATKVLPVITDAVSAFGGGAESLERVVINLQQISARAKLTGEDLRDIARGSMIPATQIIIEQAQKAGKAITSEIGNAGIKTREGLDLLFKGLEERYKGATLAIAGNFNQLVSNLLDRWKVFNDTIIRESGFLDFLKAAISLISQAFDRFLKENTAAIRAWGQSAIGWVNLIIRAVGGLLEVFSKVTAGILTVVGTAQSAFQSFAQEKFFGVVDKARAALETIGVPSETLDRVKELYNLLAAKPEDVSGLQKALETLGSIDLGQGFTTGAEKLVKDIEAEMQRLIKLREGIVGKPPPAPPEGPDTDAARAAAARAEAEEKILRESLKRQEALIEASFDERRAQIDEDFNERIRREPAMAEQINRARLAALRQVTQEEATFTEHVRLDLNDKLLAAELDSIAKAKAANAGKVDALAKLDGEVLVAKAQHATREAEIVAKTAEIRRRLSKELTDDEIREVERLAKAEEAAAERSLEARRAALQAEADLLSARRDLVEAQAEGLLLSDPEALQRRQALEREAFENRAAQREDELAAELANMQKLVDAHEATQTDIDDITATHQTVREGLDVEFLALQQRHLNELNRGWIDFVRDVESALGDFLFDWFSGQIDSIKDVLDGLKNYFFRILADIIAVAARQAIVVPIVTAVLGGPGGGAGGGLLTQGGIIQALGLGSVAQSLTGLFGPTGMIGGAFTAIGDILLTGAQSISRWVNQLVYPGIKDIGTSISTISEAMQLFGGFAGVGANLFQAFTAQTVGGRVGGALGAGAAGVSIAATLGLLPAALGPIGLALAAIVPLLGNFLGSLGAPAGPRAVIRPTGGLGVGVEEGRLRLEGGLTSRIARAERLEGFDLGAVQEQLNQSVTALVEGMLNAINEVALTPETLLGPTRDAVKQALAALQPINSSNRKKLQADMEAQVKFAGVQVASFLLDPLNLAAEQLRAAPLQTQIERFTPTIAGMADVFKAMNAQIDELSRVANTDVLRQLSGVRNRVENFANQLVEVAGQLATDIVDGVTAKGQEAVDKVLSQSLRVQALTVPGAFTQRLQAATALRTGAEALGAAGLDFSAVQRELERLFTSVITDAFRVIDTALATGPFDQALNVILAIPDAVVALNPVLAQYKALAQAFAPLVNALAQNIRTLEDGLKSQSTRIAEGRARILELGTAIKDAGTNVTVALPLYDQLRQEILANAELQIQAIQEIAQAWESAMSQIESDVLQFAAALGDFGTQAGIIAGKATAAVIAYNKAVASGDTAGAIRAIQDYAAALVAQANLQIELIRRNRQEVLDAQQAQIDATTALMEVQQEYIDGIQDQIDAQQDAIDSVQKLIDAEEQRIQGLEKEADALHKTIAFLERVIGLSDRIGEITRTGLPPVRAADQLRAEIAATEAAGRGLTGDAAVDNLEKLIGLNEELLRLGEQTSMLHLMQEALNNLEGLRTQLEAAAPDAKAQLTDAQQQLAATERQIELAQAQIDAWQQQIDGMHAQQAALQGAIDVAQVEVDRLTDIRDAQQKQLTELEKSTFWDEQIHRVQKETFDRLYDLGLLLLALQGPTSWEDQIKAIQTATLNQLVAMQGALSALYGASASTANAAGTSAAYDRWTAELLNTIQNYNLRLPLQTQVLNFYDAPRQRGGLVGRASGGFASLNQAMTGPLPFASGGFTVPGSGDGDHVPLMVQPGSFVLNRTASRAMGFQGGGVVPRSDDVMEELLAVSYGQLDAINHLGAGVGQALELLRQIASGQQGLSQQVGHVASVLGQPPAPSATDVQTVAMLERLAQVGVQDLQEVKAMRDVSNGMLYYLYQAVQLIKVGVTSLSQIGELIAFIASHGAQPESAVYATGGPVASLNRSMTAPLAFANGGLVPIMAEPGERVFLPPMSRAQEGALVAMNQAFPRFAGGGFTVPGAGAGDTVAMAVPSESFVLNKRASRAMGYQDGGPVRSSPSATADAPSRRPVHITIDLRGARFGSRESADEILQILHRELRKLGDTRLR